MYTVEFFSSLSLPYFTHVQNSSQFIETVSSDNVRHVGEVEH